MAKGDWESEKSERVSLKMELVVFVVFTIAKTRFRRRSTHVQNLIELGSTLERQWRDN